MNNTNQQQFIQPISFIPTLPPKIYDSNCVEFWAPINPLYVPNLNNRYWVSTWGRVCDLYSNNGTGKIMGGSYDERGYIKVGLKPINGKSITRKIHRLVMMTFYYFPGCEKYEVNHIDGNHENNKTYNLEWVTGSENRRHAIMNGLENTIFGIPIAILSDEEVWKIRALALQKRYSYNQIIDMLGLRNRPGISRHTIGRIIAETTTLYRPYWYTEYEPQYTFKNKYK